MTRPAHEPVVLRPYQQRAVDLAREHIHENPVIVLPTGSGKSVVQAEIARLANERGTRTLLLAPRREIVAQTAEHFRAMGVDTGVILAGEKQHDRPHYVAAYQTLARRKLPPAGLVLIDECSLALAPVQRALVESYPDAFRVGFDAVPLRLDGKGLGSLFGLIIEPETPRSLIQQGWLAAYRYLAPANPDLRGVKRSKGDYVPESAAERMLERHIAGGIVSTYPGGPMVLFACTIQHSQAMAAAFVAAGRRAAHLDGDTPHGERARILGDLRSGRLDIVCNVDVIGRGFDSPTLAGVILARPTQSLAVFRQQVGRALRPPGPVTILDHAGNVHRHGLPDDAVEWSLRDRETKPKSIGVSTCRICYAAFQSGQPCPNCGPTGQVSVIVRHHDAPLVEVTKSPPKPISTTYATLLKQAHEENRRPGYATFMYARQHGGRYPSGGRNAAVEAERATCTRGPTCTFCEIRTRSAP